jgi:hypothetical protein
MRVVSESVLMNHGAIPLAKMRFCQIRWEKYLSVTQSNHSTGIFQFVMVNIDHNRPFRPRLFTEPKADRDFLPV